jgi:hypothetical protein
MSQATDTLPDLTGTSTVPVGANTRLRRGVSTKGIPNLVATLPAGNYPAYEQCAGEEVVLDNGARNFWWVRIAALGFTGWVSAVAVLEGGNDQPIPNVPQVPTVNY